VKKATRWAPLFSNKKSHIAQELKSEIGRVTRLWLDVIEPPSIDPASERVGDGKLALDLGIQKLQKARFDDIKRHRFDPRQMALFGRFGDLCVQQLLLGFAHPLVPLQSEELRAAVERPFGLPLAALKTHVGERIRNHENMPRWTSTGTLYSL